MSALPCEECGGEGRVTRSDELAMRAPGHTHEETCPVCNGSGKVACTFCPAPAVMVDGEPVCATCAADLADEAVAETEPSLAHCGEDVCTFGSRCTCDCMECWRATGSKAGRFKSGEMAT